MFYVAKSFLLNNFIAKDGNYGLLTFCIIHKRHFSTHHVERNIINYARSLRCLSIKVFLLNPLTKKKVSSQGCTFITKV